MMNTQSAMPPLYLRISFLLSIIGVAVGFTGFLGLTQFSAADDDASQDAGSEWTQEIWHGISGESLSYLRSSPQFYGVADEQVAVGASVVNTNRHYGSRVRGMITVPVNGVYTFWLSTSKEGKLYLGEDGTKWSRQQIAVSSKANRSAGPAEFDANRGQQSEGIELQAGDQVFVEALSMGGKNGGHVDVAWSYQSAQVNWTQGEGVTASQAANRWGSTNGTAALAIDGRRDGLQSEDSIAVTTADGAWWEVDLGEARPVDALALWNMEGAPSQLAALSDFRVTVYDDGGNELWSGSFFENGGYVKSSLRIELSELLEGIPLVRRVRVQKNHAGNSVLNLAEVEVLGPETLEGSVYQPRSLVPTEVMSAYAGEVDDADSDELRDGWELLYGFSPDAGEAGDLSGMADPDRDGWNNVEESLLGNDPFSPDSVAGGLELERWWRFPYHDVTMAMADVRFYGDSDEKERLGESDTRRFLGQNYATRMRGYIEAPVSGQYRFWLAGREGVALYLSDVAGSKYHKQRIGYLTRDEGHGWGVGAKSAFRWDTYVTQQSEEIYLEAGERYYLEAIQQKGGHDSFGSIGVAWAPPGQERRVIPGSALYSYFVTEDDLDDDFLPDAWEAIYGLDPLDNGAGDMARQGERGDFDGDGLTNREEYLLGSHPNSKDSDEDGLSDFDEVTFYGTDPGVSNDLASIVVDSVDLEEHDSTATWEQIGEALVADNFRSQIAWEFSVPFDGWWVIELTARLQGNLRIEENFPIRASIDQASMGLETFRFKRSEPRTLKFLTPYLEAGEHQFLLNLDNYVGRRNMQLLGLKVLRTGGLDADENGISDWLEDEAKVGNSLAAHLRTSIVSPAFIEGATRYSHQVSVSASNEPINVLSALGDQHWYANVPLEPTGETPIAVTFENGQISRATGITWTAWNAESAEAPRLRKGDTLKMEVPSGGSIRVWARGVEATNHEVAAGEAITYTFAREGQYKLKVTTANGVRDLVVNVVTSTLASRPHTIISGGVTRVTFTGMARGTVLDHGRAFEILSQNQVSPRSSWVVANLLARETGPLPMAVRLYEGGPIVVAGELNAINYSDALQNDAEKLVPSDIQGFKRLRTPIVMTGIPPGGYAKLVIHRAGITFLDGTRTMILRENDLSNGVAYVDFLFPEGIRGGYCHYVEFYDANGRKIGRG